MISRPVFLEICTFRGILFLWRDLPTFHGGISVCQLVVGTRRTLCL